MPEEILQADLGELERLAVAHQNAADSCATARAAHPQAVAAAGTWGTMFAEAQEAWTALINGRERTLTGLEDWQHRTAQGVKTASAALRQMNDDNTARLQTVSDISEGPHEHPHPPPTVQAPKVQIPDGDNTKRRNRGPVSDL